MRMGFSGHWGSRIYHDTMSLDWEETSEEERVASEEERLDIESLPTRF